MIIFANDNLFGLIYVEQRGPERNLTVVYAKSGAWGSVVVKALRY